MPDTSSVTSDLASTVARMEVVPTVLRALCRITGMGFGVVARVTENSWTACAVQDDIGFGIKPGQQIDVGSTLCSDVRLTRTPIIIVEASSDARYRTHRVPKQYGFESYLSVPIVTAAGEVFGSLCALDRKPVVIDASRVLVMAMGYAELISQQLSARRSGSAFPEAPPAVDHGRSSYVALLADSLRIPVQALGKCGEQLRRRAWDPVLVELAGRLDSNVCRMSSLLDGALDFARGQQGGDVDVQLTDVVDVEAVLREPLRSLLEANPGRSVVANIAPAGAVRCDPFRLQQLVRHLLVNALEHGSDSTAVGYVAVVDAGYLTIEVWNAGEPIPRKHLPKIFQPFWRGHSAQRRGAAGMGLHICSQIARAHGGTVTAASTKRHGTRFVVRIPADGPRRLRARP